MTRVYSNLGIHFLYPESWELDESEAVGGQPSVTVYSPEGAFWSVVLDEPTSSPADLAVTVLAAIKQEYAESEAEPAHETVAGMEVRGYDLSFYYVDLVSTATIRGFRTPHLTGVILCQAEDRDWDKIGEVFRAMSTSLLQGLQGK